MLQEKESISFWSCLTYLSGSEPIDDAAIKKRLEVLEAKFAP